MNKDKLIFIVDDDPFINRIVTKRFSAEGFRIDSFESGEECLDALNRNPDLVILDYIFMDKTDRKAMNGMEVLDSIKESKPELPVIMLSGQDKGEIVLELARKGIDDYIIKDNNLIDNLNTSISELFSAKNRLVKN
ncbi:MAG TPA: response regulator [Bacteroidales bacterium]|nr:response regulator [Bacteroidales bacterium]